MKNPIRAIKALAREVMQAITSLTGKPQAAAFEQPIPAPDLSSEVFNLPEPPDTPPTIRVLKEAMGHPPIVMWIRRSRPGPRGQTPRADRRHATSLQNNRQSLKTKNKTI
jgi:hypothetical protein